MAAANGGYYIPHGTKWPIMGSIGLFTLLGGFAMLLNGSASASWLMVVGAVIIVVMMIGWFGTVIGESESGTYNAQVDLSFRQGMLWFIFSEVLFFAAFFGALFYRADSTRCRGLRVKARADSRPGRGCGRSTKGLGRRTAQAISVGRSRPFPRSASPSSIPSSWCPAAAPSPSRTGP